MRFKKLAGIGLSIVLIAGSGMHGIAGTSFAASYGDAAASGSIPGRLIIRSGEESAESGKVSGGEISDDDISVTWNNSRVYKELTLGRYETITTYGVKGYEDVPFISAHDYLDILCEGKERITAEDGVMKVLFNGTEAVIDPEADTIRFDNPSRFRSAGEVEGGIVESEEFNVITFSTKNRSVQEKAKPVIISLKEYHMPVIAYEDTVLMPFLALQNTFGSAMMNSVLAYNGKDYYNVFEAGSFAIENGSEAVKESPYMKAIYSGPFSEMKRTTQAYADYGYYSVCLQLDLTFGHKEEKGITTFDEYFSRMNAKAAMTSTNPSSAMLAEFMLFNYLFDSGHDSLMNDKHVFAPDTRADPSDINDISADIKKSQEEKALYDGEQKASGSGNAGDKDGDPVRDVIIGALQEKGFKIPSIAPMIFWGVNLNAVKPEDYGDQRLDYSGDTAVIYFNAFRDDTAKREPSYYLDPIDEEDEKTSTFAFFYRCFEDIQKHRGVKNVVINLSDNGGGAAAALVSVLGFLSEDGEVRITDMDLMAGNYREEYYHVDTNLDGIADDRDGFGDRYDFYVMCSGYSYSCGNALPYYAQKNGLAKIIGTAPGGGDCVVGNFTDAYGRCAFYSCMLKLGSKENGVFISNEKATEPDLNMMPSVFDIYAVPWFDAEGIADAVHQYQNGKDKILYHEEDESEAMSNALEKIFGGLGKSTE